VAAEDQYRAVMMVDPPPEDSPLDGAGRDYLFGGIWSRPGLSVRDRRFVTLACVSARVDVPEMEAHIYAALKSGDLTIEQLNELTLQLAVYSGWPKASQLEGSVRLQWQRLHDELGKPAPPFRQLGIDELGPADPGERIAGGMRSVEEINLVPSPSHDSAYFYAGILNFVFGHVWLRPGLTRRERRLITIPCVGIADAMTPIQSHVSSALASGDVSYAEMEELILHFRAYSTQARAEVLQDVARQWHASHA
jgi:4-carboxymuconolactone decarboxylase